MKLITRISATLLTVLATTAFATPDKCPSIAALKEVGLDTIKQVPPFNRWGFGNLRNKYDTNVEWTFMLMTNDEEDTAKDKEEATQKALTKLNTLVSSEGPYAEDAAAMCFYLDAKGEKAAYTLTPPITPEK